MMSPGLHCAEIVPTLLTQLVQDYGKRFEVKKLWRMMQFAEYFHKEEIVVSLIRQLTWTHFIALIPLKDKLKRELPSPEQVGKLVKDI